MKMGVNDYVTAGNGSDAKKYPYWSYSAVNAVTGTRIAGLMCPSDNPEQARKLGGSTDTSLFFVMSPTIYGAYGVNDDPPDPITRNHQCTNYLPSGGRFNDDAKYLGYTGTNATLIDTYKGIFRSAEANGMKDIIDGTSTTVAFGEVTGGFYDASGSATNSAGVSYGKLGTNRMYSFAWTCGPVPMHWMAKSMGGVPYDASDRRYYRFSSFHSGGMINYVMADGAVKAIPLGTDPDVMLQIAGKADGMSTSLD